MNKSAQIIDNIADLKFKEHGKDNDDMWDRLMVFWGNENMSKKTKIMALNGTEISSSPLTEIPIPGALYLLGTGLVGLTGIRRIRSKKK